jgi:hypothetical protein
MKTIARNVYCAGLLFGFATFMSAATMTMTGAISDSMCGLSHAKMTSAHPGLTDHACTLGCVRKGAKYVFVSQGKIYEITNQNQADLAKEAGNAVTVTGDMNGNTITVTKVAMLKK